MFAHHNQLFSGNESLETSVEGLVARLNYRLSVNPDHVLCPREKLFHEFVLGAHCHVDNPIVRRIAQSKRMASIDQMIDRDLCFINGLKFHIAIHRLASCTFHDNMNPGAERRWYNLGVGT